MKSVIPATETSRADNAGTWREKESILTSAKRSRWKRRQRKKQKARVQLLGDYPGGSPSSMG